MFILVICKSNFLYIYAYALKDQDLTGVGGGGEIMEVFFAIPSTFLTVACQFNLVLNIFEIFINRNNFFFN